jgi:hypothetical protein
MTLQEALDREFGGFVGKKLVAIEPLATSLKHDLGWEWSRDESFALIFEDGSVLIPSQYPEGNGPGFLIPATAE